MKDMKRLQICLEKIGYPQTTSRQEVFDIVLYRVYLSRETFFVFNEDGSYKELVELRKAE